ncbi:MAG: DUF6048 family protein [Flavobacteriales bacterium]
MYKYFINIFVLFVFVDGFSQEQQKDSVGTSKDSIVYKSPYGIRVGIDLSKPILSSIKDSYTGLEIVGDYRISKKFYIAAEVGFEEETTQEDFTNSTSKGNYIRLGFNYNAYENWLDMNNEIFAGYRYGFSIFDQTLNSYTPNVVRGEGNGITYFTVITNTNASTTSLNTHWSELVVGFKAETFKNVFISVSGSYKILMSSKDPENFQTLYSPGFNRVFESGTGFGFNYTISYLIPFTKR